MTGEHRFILECLADLCNDRKTAKPSYSVDMDRVYEEAVEQSIDGLIYYQCQEWIGNTEIYASFKDSFLSHVFVSANRKDLFGEITDALQKEGIDILCMKGSVFRDYYPVPEFRSMGDIDFVIHIEDREKTDRIMREALGYQKMIDHPDVWTYWIEQFMYEIHSHMFYEHLTTDFDYRSYFDQAWEHAQLASVFTVSSDNVFIPDENFHFLYLMAHTAKHIINNGSGFRAYLDMVMMCRKKGSEMNWNWISKELKKMGLLEFTKTCFALCERWFDVNMPLKHHKLDEDFYMTVTEKTFTDGIFGLENTENKRARVAKEIRRSSSSYWVTSIRYVLYKLFPPYSDMQLIPWYSFVDGRPWLMPFAWVYRWVYCLIKKRKTGAEILTEPFLKRSEIEKRQELIQDWGL